MDVKHGLQHEHEISHRSSSVLQITSHIMYDHKCTRIVVRRGQPTMFIKHPIILSSILLSSCLKAQSSITVISLKEVQES